MDKLDRFSQAIKFQKPLVLDGAMGTILQKHFPELQVDGLWMNGVIKQRPEFITDLHLRYLESGADIITTFTYRTNPFNVAQDQTTSYQILVQQAVECAKIAREKFKNIKNTILIAGSNPPCYYTYDRHGKQITQQELRQNHSDHIDSLWQNGVDFILNESIGYLDEIKIICELCSQKNIPYIISLYCNKEGKLSSGEDITEALEIICKYNPIAFGFNCILKETMENILKRNILNDVKWGSHINCGEESFFSNYAQDEKSIGQISHIVDAVSPQDFKEFSDQMMNQSPCYIGSCCCSNPSHTKVLRELFDQRDK